MRDEFNHKSVNYQRSMAHTTRQLCCISRIIKIKLRIVIIHSKQEYKVKQIDLVKAKGIHKI